MPRALSLSASAIPALLRLIADKAPATTLGELIADPSLGAHTRALTLRQLAQALASAGVTPGTAAKPARSAAAAPKQRGGKRADRAAHASEYDTKVLAEISAAREPVGAVAVRDKIGGNPDEFRAAVERLIAAKKIKKSGIAKGTRYRTA